MSTTEKRFRKPSPQSWKLDTEVNLVDEYDRDDDEATQQVHVTDPDLFSEDFSEAFENDDDVTQKFEKTEASK